MPLYDCGAPECEECQREFGPDRSKAIAADKTREERIAQLRMPKFAAVRREGNFGDGSPRYILRATTGYKAGEILTPPTICQNGFATIGLAKLCAKRLGYGLDASSLDYEVV